MHQILVVERDDTIVEIVATALSDERVEVQGVSNVARALDYLAKNEVVAVLTGLGSLNNEGYDLLSAAQTQHPDTLRIVFFGASDSFSWTMQMTAGLIELAMQRPPDRESVGRVWSWIQDQLLWKDILEGVKGRPVSRTVDSVLGTRIPVVRSEWKNPVTVAALASPPRVNKNDEDVILIVDEQSDRSAHWQGVLSDAGIGCVAATCTDDALAVLSESEAPVSAVFCAEEVGATSGKQFLATLASRGTTSRRVLLSTGEYKEHLQDVAKGVIDLVVAGSVDEIKMRRAAVWAKGPRRKPERSLLGFFQRF